VKIGEHQKFSRAVVARLAKDGRLADVIFVADDYPDGNGFVMTFKAQSEGETVAGALYKRDGLPRAFFTPLALMENARVLGVTRYSIDASKWRAEAYSPYKAQTKWRKQQGDSDD